MAITNGYATLAELKTRVGISDSTDDTLLEDVVEAASRKIDGYCQRRFFADGSASARTYRADDPWVIEVDDFDPATAPTVKTDTTDNGTYDTTWTVTTDYVLEPHNPNVVESGAQWRIRAVGVKSFPGGRRPCVQVTADWGWPAVPHDIREACLLLAARYFKRKDAPFAVAGFGEFGDVRLRDDTDVAALLAPYRRVVLVG